MGFTDLLPHTGTIWTLGASSQDSRGNEAASYASAGTVACRAWSETGTEYRDGQWVQVENWRAVVPASTSITTKDRFGVLSRTFEILEVSPVYGRSAEHHRILRLQEAT